MTHRSCQPDDTLDRSAVAPRVDIFEGEADFLLHADVPGATDESVRLTVARDSLVLEATARLPAPEGRALVAELGDVAYRRAFQLPRTVDTERISAELRDGVLRVKLPKTAAAQPRRIEVTTVQ